MASNQSTSVLELVPDSWFEPVVGLWVVLLAGLGIQMTVYYGHQVLGPLGAAPWAAVAVTTVVAAVAYGVFGVGLVYVYREYRGFEPRFVRRAPDGVDRRWLAGLAALPVVLMVLGGVPTYLLGRGLDVAIPLIGYGLPAYPDGMSGLALGLAGVNDMVNQAPLVGFAALLAGLLMGPATAALFHGVLQDTLARVAPPAVAVAGTAAFATVLLGHGASAPANTAVVFGFVLGVAYAYRETENLVVAMAAYGLFDALALVLGWLSILASLHAHGHLLA